MPVHKQLSGIGQEKTPLSPAIRDKGALYLCGTTLVPLKTALMCAVSGANRRSLMGKPFGALLGGDICCFFTAASHQNGSSLRVGKSKYLSSSLHYI